VRPGGPGAKEEPTRRRRTPYAARRSTGVRRGGTGL